MTNVSVQPSHSMTAVAAAKTPKAFTRSQNTIGYLLLSPWLFGFFLFSVIPFAASLGLAFTDYDILSPPNWVGLDNFQRMFFDDIRYWRSVKATLYYVFAAIPLRLMFALGLAALLNNTRKAIPIYRALYYAPSVVGASVAVSVMWREIFGTTGLVNAALAFVGIPKVIWLGNPRTAIWTLIILGIWQFGSPMLIFLAGLKQVPTELYESASIDGAGKWSSFLKITLPILSPVILFNLVMQMITGLRVFTQAFIVTGGAPLDTTNFYALYLYRRAFETLEMGYGSAMAWVLLLVTAVFTALVFKSSSYWVHYESGGKK